MRKFTYIILSAAAVILTSCTKDIDYKGPDGDRMLIVNCITQAGRVPVFEMSHSAFFLDPYHSGHILSSGVDVSVTINGQTGSAHYSDSLKGYADNRILNQGDIISVKATHPEYGTVTATDTVPYIQDCSTQGYTQKYVPGQTIRQMFGRRNRKYDDSTVDSTWVVQVEIGGRDNEPDFYFLTIEPTMTWFKYNDLKACYDTITDSILYKIPARTRILLGQANAATTVLDDAGIDSRLEYNKRSFIFDDLYLKDMGNVSFDLLMQKPDTLEYIYTYGKDSVKTDSMSYSIANKIKDEVIYEANIKLYTLSGTYYRYHKSAKDFSSSSTVLMSEPVTIIHNVKGGAGILATYALSELNARYTYKFK